MRDANDYPEVEGYDTRTYGGGEAVTTPEERAERERLEREAREEAYEPARKELRFRFSHERLFCEVERRLWIRPKGMRVGAAGHAWFPGIVPWHDFERRLKNRPGGAPFSEDGRPLFDFDPRYLQHGYFPEFGDTLPLTLPERTKTTDRP